MSVGWRHRKSHSVHSDQEPIVLLSRLGYRNIQGYLAGGFEAWENADLPVDRIDRIAAGTFLARFGFDIQPGQILDVRTPEEHDEAAIPGSLNAPLAHLTGMLDTLPRDKTLYLHCASGYRCMVAASLLKARGYIRVAVLEGGYRAFQSLMEKGIVHEGVAH